VAEVVRDSAAHAGPPSRYNVFEFSFPASDTIPAPVSPRAAVGAASTMAGANPVGQSIPFVSMPAGSPVGAERSGLLDSAPMDPTTPGPFSTGGRFMPRSSPPRPLYPTGPLIPTSSGRVPDRHGPPGGRSVIDNSSPTEGGGLRLLPIFDLLDRPGGGEGSTGEMDSQGTGIPMLDEYIRYLNREYPG
jgi:hypothetical protein